jgi:hypothetical protein
MKRSEKRNPRCGWLTIVSATTCLASFAHGQVTFQFDYSYGGTSITPEARALMVAAGNALSSRLGDTLSVVSPGGGNSWSINFNDPGSGGSQTISNPTIGANTIVVYVGERGLGSGVLGQAGPGAWSASGTSDWITTVDRRGSSGYTQNNTGLGHTATDFAPWGGSITFGTGISWYFDSDPSTVEGFAGQSDFYSVAVHELAHVLGYGTSDSWNNDRSGSSFLGPASLALNNPLSLSSDFGHWNNGTMSYVGTPGNLQEAAMDPNLTVGTRKYFTELDYAGLTDIGWQVSPVPEPAEIAGAVGLGLVGFASYRRRLKKPA